MDDHYIVVCMEHSAIDFDVSQQRIVVRVFSFFFSHDVSSEALRCNDAPCVAIEAAKNAASGRSYKATSL